MKNLIDQSPYDILGVDLNAPKKTIEDAFARQRGSRNIREAREILVSPEKRLAVDVFIPDFTSTTTVILEASETITVWDDFLDRRAIIRHDAQAIAELVIQDIFNQPRLQPEAPTRVVTAPVMPIGDLFSIPAEAMTVVTQQQQAPGGTHVTPKKSSRRIMASWIVGISALSVMTAVVTALFLVAIKLPQPVSSVAIIATLPATTKVAMTAKVDATLIPTTTDIIASVILETNTPARVSATNTALSPMATATLLSTPTVESSSTPLPATDTRMPPSPTRTPVATVFKTATATFENYVISSIQAVNIRACPRTDCSVITSFQPGTSFDVDKEVEGDVIGENGQWYHLIVNSKDAYVHSSLAQSASEVK